MPKRYQQTIRCPKCNTANILKARVSPVTGITTFNVDPSMMRCWNCGGDLRQEPKRFPFGSNYETEGC